MSRLTPAVLLLFVLAVLLSVGLPLRSARAAPSLVGLSQSCAAGKVSATLSWQGANTDGKEQWVDYSFLDNGWSAGTFQNAGPLSPSANTYSLAGLPPSSALVARINQKLANDTWQSSPTLSFSTVACAATDSATGASGATGGTTGAPVATSTPSAPTPTPSPTVTPTPVPATYQILGFSDHTSNGGPPSDLVPPGGLLQSCNPLNVYAFVRWTNVRATQEFFVSWLVNNNSQPRAKFVVAPGSGVGVLDYPIDEGAKAQYTVRLQIDRDKPPQAEAAFTLQC